MEEIQIYTNYHANNLLFLNTLDWKDLIYVKQIIDDSQIIYTTEEHFKEIINNILINKSIEEEGIHKFRSLINSAGVSIKLNKAINYGMMPFSYVIKNNVVCQVYKVCTNSPYCRDKKCKKRHQLPSKQLCKSGTKCKRKSCVFKHNCYEKENCDKSCNFFHANCKHDTLCKKSVCYYDHPNGSAVICVNDNDCYNGICHLLHPTKLKKQCLYKPCTNPYCHYSHEDNKSN